MSTHPAADQQATGFTLTRTQRVDALNVTVEEYSHESGAKHFHLASESTENVFMVAFRTVPHDSTGVAHILEHTALCGSERYPVRDPFFLMIRRSLNTFMNAFTTSDYTAYPFASQNRKDYFNLMDVYLDAVFFSRLDPLDFAQEGHRVEFEDPQDPSSPLVYKGVVFNEMKGDTSSPMSMLYHGIQSALYPTSTYHYNSGGDPVDIPSLSYGDLKQFYKTHYHPSNAVFMTFGDIDAATQQQMISDRALSKLPKTQVEQIAVSPERRYDTPVEKVFSYPADDDDTSQKTHIVLAWLLGENTDLRMLLRGHLLSDVLLDTSASPLRQALEKTDLALSASPMCGFEEDHMEMNFMCGVEGSEPEHAEAIEKLIIGVLEDVAEKGIPEPQLEAVLHQLELSQREIGGDGWPYGLQLIFSCMSAAVHRGDPIGLLDIDGALEELRREIRDPEFIKQLVRDQLLDNPHRVRVVMQPSRALGAQLIEDEKQKLESIREALTPTEADNIVSMAAALKAHQAQEEDLSVLPKVTRDDIPAKRQYPGFTASSHQGMTITHAAAGTNGIVYHQLISELPALDESLMGLLPIYTHCVTETGSNGRDYLLTQQEQHAHTGGITAFTSIRSAVNDVSAYKGFLTLSSRTLNPKADAMMDLVRDTALSPRFDETDRVRELVDQLTIRRVNGIAGNGHQYAMSAAAAQLNNASAVNDFLGGIPAILRLKQLARSLENPAGCEALSTSLAELHQRLRDITPELLIIAEADAVEEKLAALKSLWAASDTTGHVANSWAAQSAGDQAFVVTTQVNYCASAFRAVPEAHEDSAALSVLAGVLRNNFLHSELREKGGAYGGGAGHDATNGVFRFYSYRDPRLAETFDSFEASVHWVLNTAVTDDMLEEAVLGIISSIDSPGSPAGEIRQAFHHSLHGRSSTHRAASRARYLDVNADDLRRVAETYLTGPAARAVVTSENRLSEVDNGFAITRVNET